MAPTGSYFTHLECTRCGKTYPATDLMNLCTNCTNGVLYARYDLDKASKALPPDFHTYIASKSFHTSMWTLIPHLLPVFDDENVVTLGEGITPLLEIPRVAQAVEARGKLWVKEEGINPTGSFKARGISAAVSKAKENGVKAFTIPTAGNAGSALAAYGARAGIKVDVFMPDDTPKLFKKEVRAFGATNHEVKGLIDDAGALGRKHATETGAFDVSTLKEPYRVEGKKTLGYELFIQLNGRLPDVIIYPTGGGTGLVGMWKAFAELRALHWLPSTTPLPRMVVVQSTGCAPIVRAFEQGVESAKRWEDADSYASGIRVPVAVGDYLILRAVRESGGTAIAVNEREIEEYSAVICKSEGIFAAPEGGATLAAYVQLRKEGWIKEDEEVVLFNTGTGLKYPLLAGEEL